MSGGGREAEGPCPKTLVHEVEIRDSGMSLRPFSGGRVRATEEPSTDGQTLERGGKNWSGGRREAEGPCPKTLG